jgi:heme/copper-type cytochrome/quinol oxidase subunit 2
MNRLSAPTSTSTPPSIQTGRYVVSFREPRNLKRNVIILLLALCAMAPGMSAPQVKGYVEDVKNIDVTASRFQFDPATITVAQGDRVRLRLHSADRTHAFAIKAFRVKALIPTAGEAVTVEFVADQAGSFDFTCAEYCGAGHARMKGRLVVVARGK